MSVFFFTCRASFLPLGTEKSSQIYLLESGPSCPGEFFFFEYHAICIDGLINNSVVSIEHLVPFPSSRKFYFVLQRRPWLVDEERNLALLVDGALPEI